MPCGFPPAGVNGVRQEGEEVFYTGFELIELITPTIGLLSAHHDSTSPLCMSPATARLGASHTFSFLVLSGITPVFHSPERSCHSTPSIRLGKQQRGVGARLPSLSSMSK